jgi:formylglycine-generating enzyme required for sulfatase activity
MKRALGIATVLFLLGAVMLLGIAMVLFLVGAVTLIEGCSNGKDPQEKEEPAVEKVTSVSNEKDITKEPTKKESSGKEEVTDLGKDVKLEMILIPAGKFVMGSPESEKGHRINETQHEVTITKPFYMGKYEVTQEQWDAVMINNRSFYRGPKLPVTSVSWENCQEFIKKLNAKTSGGYRLPTEAEWEYSCRAGTTTAYSYGDSITKNDSNVEGLSTKVVGSYKPNAFGLYDMHGNVWEWCEDWKVDYPKEAVIDPKGPEAGKNRVLRGGSFTGVGLHSRSANWFDNLPSTWNIDYLGFRLAKTK